METYKSVEIGFFKKGKIIYIGSPKTPKIVKMLCNKNKCSEVFVGRSLEYLSVTMFVLSVVYLIN